METLKMITNYIRYVSTHREFNRNIERQVKKKYSLNIRIAMTVNYVFHDLNKIFTPKFLHYVIAYDPVISCKNLDFTKFNKVSMHDMWLLDGSERSKKLYKHIFRLMEDNRGFNPAYLDLVAETFIKMSKHYGEDPIATYFRHYHQFKFVDGDRYYFEEAIGIDFDDYSGNIPDLSVEDIFRTCKNKQVKAHILWSLLNNHGINILEILNIKEKEVL